MSSERPATAAAWGDRMIDRLRHAPARRRHELLAGFLQEQLACALGVEKADIDRDDGLMNLGMDSLKAVEAKLYLEDELGIELGSSLLFDHPTIDSLASFLLEALALEARPAAPGADAAVQPATSGGIVESGSLDDLSTDEVAALLSAELAGISRAHREPAGD